MYWWLICHVLLPDNDQSIIGMSRFIDPLSYQEILEFSPNFALSDDSSMAISAHLSILSGCSPESVVADQQVDVCGALTVPLFKTIFKGIRPVHALCSPGKISHGCISSPKLVNASHGSLASGHTVLTSCGFICS